MKFRLSLFVRAMTFAALTLSLPALADGHLCKIEEIIAVLKAADAHAKHANKATFAISQSLSETHEIGRYSDQIMNRVILSEEGIFKKVLRADNPNRVEFLDINPTFRAVYEQHKDLINYEILVRAPLFKELNFVDRILAAKNCDEVTVAYRQYVRAIKIQLALLEKEFGGSRNTWEQVRSTTELAARVCNLAGKSKFGRFDIERGASGGNRVSDMAAMSRALGFSSRTLNGYDIEVLMQESLRKVIKAKTHKSAIKGLSAQIQKTTDREQMPAEMVLLCNDMSKAEDRLIEKIKQIDAKTLAAVGIQ